MSDIFQLLKKDHERHRTLLDLIEKTHGDSDGRNELFERFRKDALSHANAEEQSLYAAMLEEPALQDKGRHSVSEHKEIDDYVKELEDTDMSSSAWLATFRKLKHRYEHHIDEEEKEIFKAAEQKFDHAKRKELGGIFAARKPEEKDEVKAA